MYAMNFCRKEKTAFQRAVLGFSVVGMYAMNAYMGGGFSQSEERS